MQDNVVSIVLLTYNQSSLVLETLDSIYRQTYSTLELVISDDHSVDNTLDICSQWIEEHKARFINTIIVTSDVNTGISGNINRGIKHATGRWIEKVDGDDILEHDAVESYVQFMLEHPEAIYTFARMHPFGDDEETCRDFEENILKYDFFDCDAKEQYRRLMLNQVYVPAPTNFFDRVKSIKLGILCDESIPMVDDWPRWISLTRQGHKLYFLDKITVQYRSYGLSMSSGRVNSPFQRSQMLFYIKYQFRYNFFRHPRSSWIKFVKYKQYLTHKKIWSFFEWIGRNTSKIYCKIRHSNVDDWQKMDDAINYRTSVK